MKTLLILGAGTGGTIVANKMARRLDSREWQVVVVDRDGQHLYQPGLLFLPFEMYQPRDLIKPKRRLLSSRVNLILDEVESIEPAANRVKVTGRADAMRYDELVVALGCDIAPEETPGMKDGGWRRNIFDFYTLEGAAALGRCLRNWPGGRLVVNVAEMPIKCPVAPLEFLFLADWFFRQRGMRGKVELIYATPLSGAFTKPKAAATLGGLLDRKGIRVVSDFALCEVDNARTKLVSYDKKEVGYDLLVTVPVNKGAEVIGRCGLGDELELRRDGQIHFAIEAMAQRVGDWRRVGCAVGQGGIGGALYGGHAGGESISPYPGRGVGGAIRRPCELFYRIGFRACAADRLQLHGGAAARGVPVSGGGAVCAAEGIGGQPLGQAVISLAILEPAAARAAAVPSGLPCAGRSAAGVRVPAQNVAYLTYGRRGTQCRACRVAVSSE